MGPLLIILGIVLLAWWNRAIVRRLRREATQALWSWGLAAAWLMRGALGSWSSLFLKYQPFAELRIFGAPLPIVALHGEGPRGQEQWVDFVSPWPWLLLAANVLIVALLAGGVVGLLFWGSRHRAATQDRPHDFPRH